MDEQMGLELTEDNLETVLDEIRPYLVGAARACARLGVLQGDFDPGDLTSARIEGRDEVAHVQPMLMGGAA